MRLSFIRTQPVFTGCFVVWCLIQVAFFLPRDWPVSEMIYTFKADCGEVTVIQKGRKAKLIGACSDRYERFVRLEIVPGLRRRGVSSIEKIVLKSHAGADTRALKELLKNFRVQAIVYPVDTAERMRKTFYLVGRDIRLIAAAGYEGS